MATLIYPAHEQLYPTKLLPHRLEEYVRDDGSPPTTDRAYAKRVTGEQVLDAIRHAFVVYMKNAIDERYFVGTVFHEAGAANEWDTEVATPSNPTGFVSVGPYQIGQEEAERFGYSLAEMLDLDKASICMTNLANANRTALRFYAQLPPQAPDPDYVSADGTVWKAGTMRAYLAIAHNHGLGYAKATIAAHGMDWAAYKVRNPKDLIVAHGYGEDCVTGGPFYPHDTSSDPPRGAPGTIPKVPPNMRVLELETPRMVGTDVQELQRHLRAFNPTLATDGVYGPITEREVRKFQQLAGLKVDGKVGTQTWPKILSIKPVS